MHGGAWCDIHVPTAIEIHVAQVVQVVVAWGRGSDFARAVRMRSRTGAKATVQQGLLGH